MTSQFCKVNQTKLTISFKFCRTAVQKSMEGFYLVLNMNSVMNSFSDSEINSLQEMPYLATNLSPSVLVKLFQKFGFETALGWQCLASASTDQCPTHFIHVFTVLKVPQNFSARHGFLHVVVVTFIWFVP